MNKVKNTFLDQKDKFSFVLRQVKPWLCIDLDMQHSKLALMEHEAAVKSSL